MSDWAAWILAQALVRGCNAIATAILWANRGNITGVHVRESDTFEQPSEAVKP
jgi:hypothetical protein